MMVLGEGREAVPLSHTAQEEYTEETAQNQSQHTADFERSTMELDSVTYWPCAFGHVNKHACASVSSSVK